MIKVNFLESSEVTTDRIYQWDIGRVLEISNIGTTDIPSVQFCNKKSEKAISVEATEHTTNTYRVSVPNSLLQEEHDITAYLYIGNEDEGKTIKVIHIPVTKRPRPETYVPKDDEGVIDFLTITNDLKSLLNGLVITEYNDNDTYVKPNMVYYQGQSYICKSEAEITGVLPTDTTKWGLMCKHGANVSTITHINDTFNFTLEDGTVISVQIASGIVTADSCEALVGYDNSKGTIEERLTKLGFKEGAINLDSTRVKIQNVETFKTDLKRQGNYVIGYIYEDADYEENYITFPSSTNEFVIGTLPEDFRPKENQVGICELYYGFNSFSSVPILVQVDINTNGEIKLKGYDGDFDYSFMLGSSWFLNKNFRITFGYEVKPL